MLVDQPVGALPAAGLLIRRRAEDDVAAQAGDRIRGRIAAGRTRRAGEAAHDLDFHRHHRLHIDRAAAPDVAVGQIAGERVVGPAGRLRGHDVEMREKEQRVAASPVAVNASDYRTPAGERFHDRGPEPLIGEHLLQVSSGKDLVAGRVDGLDPNQRSQQLDQFREFDLGKRRLARFDCVSQEILRPHRTNEMIVVRAPRSRWRDLRHAAASVSRPADR
jgi:hypothetical protein